MLPLNLTDEQWQKILPFLSAHPKVYVGQKAECRKFIGALLWMSLSGSPWRLLPKEYGNWNAIYRRFVRWTELGVFKQLRRFFAADPEMERLALTLMRVHPHAAGAPGKRRARRASMKMS